MILAFMMPMFYLGERYSEQIGKKRKKCQKKLALSVERDMVRVQGAAPGVKKDALHRTDI